MNKAALSFTGLGHAYSARRWVFRNYAARLDRGRILALLGPNGRGKTTLLRLLVGAMKPTEGALRVNGRTAFVPQLFHAAFDYSVVEMVLMGRAQHVGLLAQPSRKDEQAAFAALDRFGLADLARRPFHQLSGGQRQLAIIARALVSEADILILDEPASALDLKNQALILDWMRRLARDEKLTLIFTTHHPHHALEAADDALLMMGEEKFAHGSVNEALSEENLAALYGVPMKRLAFQDEGRWRETIVPVWRATPS
jgi:iron complex transport system ATP-binding protein